MSKEKPTMKLCKHCKSEIPYSAKVCPQCRKKQGGIVKWIVIAVVVLAIIGAATGGGDKENKPQQVSNQSNDTTSQSSNHEESSNTAEKPKEEEPIKDTFSVGEMAEMNDVQVTMLNYEESTGSEYNKPTDGNVFVLVEFEIANNSDEELAISSMMSFKAYADDYALNYSLSAMIDNQKNQLDGSVAAGKKMKGAIGYEVPTDWKEIEIHFTDNVWSNDKFKFLIEK